MIQVRVRAFHLDTVARCEHGRALCLACGVDPFNTPQSLQNTSGDVSKRLGFGFDHGAVDSAKGAL